MSTNLASLAALAQQHHKELIAQARARGPSRAARDDHSKRTSRSMPFRQRAAIPKTAKRATTTVKAAIAIFSTRARNRKVRNPTAQRPAAKQTADAK
jgi:hypothetical protein